MCSIVGHGRNKGMNIKSKSYNRNNLVHLVQGVHFLAIGLQSARQQPRVVARTAPPMRRTLFGVDRQPSDLVASARAASSICGGSNRQDA